MLVLLLLLANIVVRVFHQHRNPFNFISNMFLVTLHVGGITKETCPPASLKSNTKPWNKLILEYKKINFKIYLTRGSISRQLVKISTGGYQKHIAISGIFPTSWKTFGKVGIQSFHLRTLIVIFTLCFHFYIFKGTLCTKFRNLTKTWVPLSNVARVRLSFTYW